MSKAIDLDELEKKCKAATPGPWQYPNGYRGMDTSVLGPPHRDWHGKFGGAVVAETSSMGIPEHQWQLNASFIAAANPQTILELIRRVRAAEEHVKKEHGLRRITKLVSYMAGALDERLRERKRILDLLKKREGEAVLRNYCPANVIRFIEQSLNETKESE